MVLRAIELAAAVEVAALLWERDNEVARRLLDGDGRRRGLRQRLGRLAGLTRTDFPAVWNVFEPWGPAVEEALTAAHRHCRRQAGPAPVRPGGRLLTPDG